MRWEQAFSLWYTRFWGSGESFDAQTGGKNLDWYDNTAVGISFGCHGMADTEAKFLIVRTLLGAAEAGFSLV